MRKVIGIIALSFAAACTHQVTKVQEKPVPVVQQSKAQINLGPNSRMTMDSKGMCHETINYPSGRVVNNTYSCK